MDFVIKYFPLLWCSLYILHTWRIYFNDEVWYKKYTIIIRFPAQRMLKIEFEILFDAFYTETFIHSRIFVIKLITT